MSTGNRGDGYGQDAHELAPDSGTHADRQNWSKASFIPAGNQKSEFNVVASVSKAARAAKSLNASIASK